MDIGASVSGGTIVGAVAVAGAVVKAGAGVFSGAGAAPVQASDTANNTRSTMVARIGILST